MASRRSAPSGHVATTTTTQKWGSLFTWPKGPFSACHSHHASSSLIRTGSTLGAGHPAGGCGPAPTSGIQPSGMHPQPGPGCARVRRRRPAPSPRVPRSLAASYLWGPCASRGAQTGGVRLPPPRSGELMPGGRPYAVPRRTRRRGDAVRGAAVPAGWGRRRAGTACACCARYSTSWSPASSNSCS